MIRSRFFGENGSVCDHKKGIPMKKVKLGSAIIALLALGVVACSGSGSSEAPASSSPAPASSSSPAPASSSSEAPASSSSEAPASSSEAPAPAGDAVFTWTSDDIKAGMSNASAKEVKDETGDVQFTVYKLGTANDTLTLKWTPTAEQAGQVSFVLNFTTKASNATKATFWATDSGSAKMSVSVDGTEMEKPTTENPNFEDLAGGADGVVESDAADSGTLANPIDYALCSFTAVAGQEHTIVVTYLGGGYSFYIAGAKIVK